MRWLRFVLVLAGIVVVGGVASVSSSGGVDVVDEATLGERSNQTVCNEDEIRCVDAVLESSAWRCSGVNASSFSCNVSFWLNLTVRGPSVCASGGVNVTDELAPGACTSGIEPFEHEVGGPVALTFDAGEEERLVNVSGEVCLEDGSEVACEVWRHDPILLPNWEQWDNGDRLGFYLPAGDHQICLGDSSGWTASGDVGPGCMSAGIIFSDSHCKGGREDYYCDITLDMIVVSHGLGVCASLASDHAQGVWEEVCSFRHRLEKSNREDATVTKRYDEIPLGGKTVLVEAELCGWAFRPFAQRYCETFYKPVFVPGNPCACYGFTETYVSIVEAEKEYWTKTVNHTTVPGVYP